MKKVERIDAELGSSCLLLPTKEEAVSLRDEIEQLIRFEMSGDPLAQEIMLTPGEGTVSADGHREVIVFLNDYCNALAIAVLRLASELDHLRDDFGSEP